MLVTADYYLMLRGALITRRVVVKVVISFLERWCSYIDLPYVVVTYGVLRPSILSSQLGSHHALLIEDILVFHCSLVRHLKHTQESY